MLKVIFLLFMTLVFIMSLVFTSIRFYLTFFKFEEFTGSVTALIELSPNSQNRYRNSRYRRTFESKTFNRVGVTVMLLAHILYALLIVLLWYFLW